MKRLLFAFAVVTGCTGSSESPTTATTTQAIWSNGDFEADTINATPPTGWTMNKYLNTGITDTRPGPQTLASLRLGAGGVVSTKVVGGAAPESQVDPDIGATGTLRFPKYGVRNAVVNTGTAGANKNVNSLKQQMTVGIGDVDPTDNKVHVRFAVAPVLQNPSHPYDGQPYYFVRLQNLTSGLTLYQDFNASGQPGVPWKNFTDLTGQAAQYTDWQLVDIAPGNATLAVGDQVELLVVAAGCSAGGHWGRIYVDAVGSGIPGLYTWGSGAQRANAGSDVTYTMNYKNGGTTTTTGSTLALVTPPNTVYKSTTGASCTTPTVGATGTVTCSLGTLAPGATGSYTITVTIPIATATGTLITNGNYSIYASGVSALVGPKVNTTVTSGAQYANLRITKTDGLAAIGWSQPNTYTIVVDNQGPLASNATVSDTMPANLTGVTWSCAGTGGGTCAATGAGNISHAVTLPVGATLTYTVQGTVIAGTGASTIVNTASVAPSGAIVDPDTTDNTAVDTDTIGTLRALTVSKLGATAAGSVTSTPAAISCGATCAADFLDGSQVNLTAAPVAGATFVGWGGACAGSATTCSVTMAGAQSVTARFAGTVASTTVSSGSPQQTAVSTAFGTALAVLVTDSSGNPIPGATVAFMKPGAGASANLAAASSVTDASGIASVVATANATPGAYAVTATVGGFTATFTLSNLGAPASVAVSSGANQSAAAGAQFADLVAIVKDAANQPVPGATVTFTAPASPTATLGGTAATTDALGLATMTAQAGTLTGSYAVTASVTGVGAPAIFALANIAGAATSLVAQTGSNQSAQVDLAFATALAVQAIDAHGNAVSGVTVTFTPPATGASATLATPSVTTPGTGVASTTAAAGTRAGSYGVVATAPGLGSVTFILQNTAGAPASIAIVSGTPQTAAVHTPFGTSLTVLVADRHDNPVGGTAVTFATPTSGASASVASTLTNASGIASTIVTANDLAGAYTATATSSAGAVGFALTNTAGAPATVTITTGGGQTATVGETFPTAIRVRVVDLYNNLISGASVTLTAPGAGASLATTPMTIVTDGSGIATGTAVANHTTGTYNVTATTGGVSSAPVTLANRAGAPTAIAVVRGADQHVTVTAVFDELVVAVTDTYGNAVPSASVTFTAPSAGATASFPPAPTTTAADGHASVAPTAGTIAGAYIVTASIVGDSTTFALRNDPGAATSLAVSAGSGQSRVVATAFAPLIAHATDDHGNDVPDVMVVFAAPATGALATLVPSSATTGATGLAQIDATAGTIAGAYSVTASAPGATPATFALTNTPGTVATLTATSGGGQAAVVDAPFASPLAVHAADEHGNPVPSATITFTSLHATFATGGTVITNASGHAEIAVTADTVATGYTATATSNQATATFALTNLAGTATAIAVTSGDHQHTAVTAIFNELVVAATDAYGNAVPDAPVTFTAPSAGATASLTPATTTTASDGRARTSPTAGSIAGAFTVTAAIPGASTTFALVSDPGAAATVAVSAGDGQSRGVATSFAPLVAHVTDAHGNDVPSVVVTFAAPTTGARATLATGAATTGLTGLAQMAATAGTITGAYTVTASATGATPAAFALTNSPGAVATLTAIGGSEQSTTVLAPFADPLVVQAYDEHGNRVPSATITFTAPHASFAAGGTTTTGPTGEAQVASTADGVATSYLATASSNGAVTTFALTNQPGQATQIFIVDGGSQQTVVARPFDAPLRVVVEDALSNVVPDAIVRFAPAGTPASAVLGATSATTGIDGIATTTATANTVRGEHVIVASIDAGATATFPMTNLADLPATITASTWASPQQMIVDQPFAAPLEVTVRDRFGNGVPDADVQYAVPSAQPSATLARNVIATDADGVGSVIATAGPRTGAYVASATVAHAATPAVFSLTNTSGAPSTLLVFDGDDQSAVVDTGFTTALTVLVVDANGNPVPNVVVSFGASTSAATATLAASSVQTDASGLARVSAQASRVTGSYSVTASLTGTTAPVAFTLTNLPGVPASITASASSTPQNAQVGTPFVRALVAHVVDSFGNDVPGVTVTYVPPAVGAAAVLGTPTTVTGSDGHASMLATANTIAGAYSVNATAPGVATPAAFALGNLPGAPQTITVGTPPQDAVVDTMFEPLVATVRDAHDNVVADVPVTFVAPAHGPTATLTAASTTTGADGTARTALRAGTIAGAFTVVATTPNGAAAAVFELTATPAAAAAVIALASATPQSAEVSNAFANPLAVEVVDTYGNRVPHAQVTFATPSLPGSELSVDAAVTDANGIASVLAQADALAGSYRVTAAVLGTTGATFELTNTSSSPSNVVIVSGGAQRTLATATFADPVVIRVVDSFGNSIAGITVTFSVPETGATATMSASTLVTDARGEGSIALTANADVGRFTLAAQAAGALTPGTTSLEVQPIPTTTTATTDAELPVDETARITIAVAADLGTPGGSVELVADGQQVGTALLVEGSATIEAPGLPVGTHTVSARYTAQGSYDASTSALVTITVIGDSGSISGGGCNAGGGGGGFALVLIALLALFARRRSIVLGVLAITSVANADPAPEGSRALSRYHAAAPDSAWFALDSATFAGHRNVSLSFVGDYAKHPLTIFDADGTVRERVVTDSFILQLGGSVTLYDALRLSARVPMAAWQAGDGGMYNGMPLASPISAFGDVSLAGDARVVGEADSALRVAVGVRVTLPTGSTSNFMSDGRVGFEPRVLVGGALGRLEYAAAASALIRETSDMAGARFGSEVRYAAAAGMRFASGKLLVGPELVGARPLQRDTASGTPLELQLGGHYAAMSHLRIGLGAGIGVVNAIGEPQWRMLAALTWTP